MNHIPTALNHLKTKAIAIPVALGILLGGFVPTKAEAGYEKAYLDSYVYYESLYSVYGYDYYTYYLGLALPSYYYYSALYYSGYYSVYADDYGYKSAGDSLGLWVFEYYMGAGDSYFLNYY